MASTDIIAQAAPVIERMLTGTARLILSVVLLGAALGKLSDPSLFLGFVSAVFGVGASGANAFFIFTICLEALLGSAVLLMGKQPWAYWSSACLFLLFAAIISYAIVIDLEASCGCFGAFLETQEANPVSLIRNVFLAATALFLAIDLSNHTSDG